MRETMESWIIVKIPPVDRPGAGLSKIFLKIIKKESRNVQYLYVSPLQL
jgi:hypothetical protein